MTYLARLKALDQMGLDPAPPPFEAFEGWSGGPLFKPPVRVLKKPFDTFGGSSRGRFSVQGHLKGWVSPKKGPLEQPPKASKGPPDYQAGLNILVDVAAPNGVSSWNWTAALSRAVSFCDNWAEAALGCGWTAEALFGLHPTAPLLRFDAMGVAFLGTDATVVGVEPDAVLFRTSSGNINRGRIPRNPQKPAWLGPWMHDVEIATGSSTLDEKAATHA